MPKSRSHMRSSRRVPALIDSDIDHEINLINHATSPEEPGRLSAATADTSAVLSTSEQPLSPTGSQAPLTKPAVEEPNLSLSGDAAADVKVVDGQNMPVPPINEPEPTDNTQENNSSLRKSRSSGKRPFSRRRPLSKEAETDIDVLYENERGCLFCGLPLFSSAALGNLDPTPWTNFAHRPSPTDIRTAQVPDPTWVWAWPEWRVNHDDLIDADKEGWEYSFMFSKKFSWHGPKWWNSFVRRRAWIRRRVKKADLDATIDPYVMNAGYFEVNPHKKPHHRSPSRTSSSVPERLSIGKKASSSASPSRRKSPPRSRSSQEVPHRASRESARARARDEWDTDAIQWELEELRTAEDLMAVLRRSRIDREKLEAVESYIKHGADDLAGLEDHMHEIMAIFVFQASRQLLLTRLTHHYDVLSVDVEKGENDEKNKGKSLSASSPEKGDEEKEKEQVERKKKRENLAAAIKHGDEEVRRLEYWSDIKGMAEKGESGGAVDPGKGWASGWEGLDKSGAKGALKDDLP